METPYAGEAAAAEKRSTVAKKSDVDRAEGNESVGSFISEGRSGRLGKNVMRNAEELTSDKAHPHFTIQVMATHPGIGQVHPVSGRFHLIRSDDFRLMRMSIPNLSAPYSVARRGSKNGKIKE